MDGAGEKYYNRGRGKGIGGGAPSEKDLAGLFEDVDVNSNKLGATVKERNVKLRKLLDGIGDMPLGSYADHTIDAFGDAYEYLMGMYASNAGESGGEYYPPRGIRAFDPDRRLW